MQESVLVKGKKLQTSKDVAEYGYAAMLKREAVAIHGFMNYLMVNSVRFSPRSLTVKIARKLLGKESQPASIIPISVVLKKSLYFKCKQK